MTNLISNSNSNSNSNSKMSSSSQPFKLSKSFLKQYATRKPNFGFNGLGELVFQRTYSRELPNGRYETFHDVCERMTNGLFRIRQNHFEKEKLVYDQLKEQATAERLFDRIFNFKIIPPGRSWWALGSSITEERKLYGALYNCGFVTTENIETEKSTPFRWAHDGLALGTGIGFDTRGAGKITVLQPLPTCSVHVVDDSREGFVESTAILLDSYFKENKCRVEFDYSKIRPAGEKIKGFGGISSGFAPLKQMHENIRMTLNKNSGEKITQRTIVDLFNHIAVSVVSGNVRRSAQIALGFESEDNEFLDLKDYNINPDRINYGYTSNNSVYVEPGHRYDDIAARIFNNGEPGVINLHHLQHYGRMCDPPREHLDGFGCNPCVEISLEPYELCNIIDVAPNNHENYVDFQESLELAFFFVKSITLTKTNWKQTNNVMMKNRRVGVSLTGIAQIVDKIGLNELKQWCNNGYLFMKQFDREISNELCIPKSVKITAVKPCGTTSIMLGASPGVHFPHSKYYIRRVRLAKNHVLMKALVESGYEIEECAYDPENTCVVSFPVKYEGEIPTIDEVNIYDQLNITAFLQKYWSDQMVSSTVTFDPKKVSAKEISRALTMYESQLKVISMLPATEEGAYKQMPYEKCSEEHYEQMVKNIKKPLDFSFLRTITEDDEDEDEIPNEEERFCTGEACSILYKN